jgi:formylglycine-generating enzyme required for sulfatase activity
LPNNWQLYDMLGNVCADWYDPHYYKQAPLDRPWKDPHGPTSYTSDSARVIRGGSWHNGAWVIRASRRQGYPPDMVNNGVGFRCAGGAIP